MTDHFSRKMVILLGCLLILPIGEIAGSDERVADRWHALLQREPFVYMVPVVSAGTSLDGTYVKTALKKGEIVPCRRCPDWIPNPGIWKINLNRGVYRIINTGTGWKSIGTYIVSGDRLLLANDPVCIHGIGVYTWQREGGRLKLEVIDDPCGIGLRAKNLTEVAWDACQSPNIEAAVTEHGSRPEACE